jgi:hypothetical protein
MASSAADRTSERADGAGGPAAIRTPEQSDRVTGPPAVQALEARGSQGQGVMAPVRAGGLQALQQAADGSSRVRQLARNDERANGASSTTAATAAPNRTGLPTSLKSGVESLSGVSLDDVRVHRNSSEPGGLGAHAFARGSDIHVAPGQESSLPHEAWHVVQQKQGRVRADTLIDGNPVNTDPALEREADHMGGKAATQLRSEELTPWAGGAGSGGSRSGAGRQDASVSQRTAVLQMDWYEKVGAEIVKRTGTKPGGYRLVKGAKGPGGESVYETQDQRKTHVEQPRTYEEKLGEVPEEEPGVEFTVDAELVRYSQDSIARTFTSGGKIQDVANSLKSGTTKPADLPAIRVFKSAQGRLVTLDNRRLWCCKTAGTQVKCAWASDEAIKAEGFKFTSGKGLEGKNTITVRN